MKLIIQSVREAQVEVYKDAEYSELEKREKIWVWILIYFGVGKIDEDRADRQNALDKFTTKLQTLKLLASPEGKIEVPLIKVGGQILVISNFTLFGSYKNGTKIDFSQSGKFSFSEGAYDYFLKSLRRKGFSVKSGKFWGDMLVSSINVGPINYIFEL